MFLWRWELSDYALYGTDIRGSWSDISQIVIDKLWVFNGGFCWLTNTYIIQQKHHVWDVVSLFDTQRGNLTFTHCHLDYCNALLVIVGAADTHVQRLQSVQKVTRQLPPPSSQVPPSLVTHLPRSNAHPITCPLGQGPLVSCPPSPTWVGPGDLTWGGGTDLPSCRIGPSAGWLVTVADAINNTSAQRPLAFSTKWVTFKIHVLVWTCVHAAAPAYLRPSENKICSAASEPVVGII